MSDIVNTLASQTGIGADLIHKGLGAVLKMLQDHLPAELFATIRGLLPDGDEMIAASESAAKEGGGLVQAATDLAGKIFGARGGAAADLFTRLGQLGFSADQVRAFVPRVLEFLRDKLPPEILEKITGLIPGLHEAAGPGRS